jgi:membrane protein
MKNVAIFWRLFKLSFDDFVEHNSLKLSAALSYYTTFSIAPILIIIISVVGIFFGVDAVQGKIYYQLNGLIGSEAAGQIEAIIKNVETTQLNRNSAIVGLIILLVSASGVFTEIQDSINYLWSIKAKPKKGWLKVILNRLLSFSLIASFGFLLLVSLAANAMLDLLSESLKNYFEDATIYLFYGINTVFTLLVTTCMFVIIFKLLPDAIVHWRDAWVGAFLTALLFTCGKLLISLYVSYSELGTIYGATASIIIILLWVYYTSIILFFGASFTRHYAQIHGGKITPKKNAVNIVRQEKLHS